GIVLGVSDRLILKLKNPQNLKEYLLEFDLKIERSLSENIYLLQVSDKKLTLEISNRLSEKEDVEYAHPDFIKQRKKR
ncbi:MAG: hypothetical protein U9Q40_10140, partial [Campylobacterota bacterium]|nr:hypothetical protein [Campylobacterota bacterium]